MCNNPTPGTPVSAADVIERMRKSSFDPGTDTAEYMKSVADRVAALDGTVIRIDTPEHFLADLKASGWFTKGDA